MGYNGDGCKGGRAGTDEERGNQTESDHDRTTTIDR